MEEKINVAEILKDKPVNTKLYSPLYGDVYLSHIGVRNDINVLHHSTINDFLYDGRYAAYKESEILLFPSKEMRDWRKFWKKGDVLVNKDNNSHIIFDKFNDDTYTTFIGKLYYETTKHGYNYTHTCSLVKTQDFDTEKSDIAQTYTNTIEKILGGKLNMETLEIEKTQPEFKDGDIVFMKGIKSGYYANCIFILKSEYKDGDERAFYYAFYNTDDKFTIAEYGNTRVHYSLRPATDSEKQQLFDALAKKGKRWDAEKKQIVDLKPKVELKPFDKVLSRRCSEDYWVLNFYSHKTDYYHICIDRSSNLYCIPYNEETAHLLGTTDDWEGGEQ